LAEGPAETDAGALGLAAGLGETLVGTGFDAALAGPLLEGVTPAGAAAPPHAARDVIRNRQQTSFLIGEDDR